MAGAETELKRGTLEMVLLNLLATDARYGYELGSEIERRTGGDFAIKEGTLYPVLYRLEDRGLIAAEWQAPARGVPRKYYRATGEGRARLESLRADWARFVTAVGRLIDSTSPSQKENQA